MRATHTAIGIVLLSLVAPAAAQTEAAPEIKGKLNPPVYGFAELSVAVGKGAVSWQVYPRPVQSSSEGNKLRFGGLPGVEYTVKATVFRLAADKETITLTESEAVVVFGTGPPPPIPPPGPTPPPEPLDPAAQRIKAAFQETFFAKAKELAAGYDRCAALTATTGADLHAKARAALKDAMSSERIPEPVITAIVPELAGLPAATGDPLSAANLATARVAFARIAKLIRQAGGIQ